MKVHTVFITISHTFYDRQITTISVCLTDDLSVFNSLQMRSLKGKKIFEWAFDSLETRITFSQ